MPDPAEQVRAVMVGLRIVDLFEENGFDDSTAISILVSTAAAYFLHRQRVTVDEVRGFTDQINRELIEALDGCDILTETSPGVYEFTPIRIGRDI